MSKGTCPVWLTRFPCQRKQVSLHILRRHRGGTGDRGVLTASSPPSTNPPRRKQFPAPTLTHTSSTPTPSLHKPSLVRTMPGWLNLVLVPFLTQASPHPPVHTISIKSCGCTSEKEIIPSPSSLSKVDCSSRCSRSPFFAFSTTSSQLERVLASEQESDFVPDLGFCFCGDDASTAQQCSDAATIPVFCTSQIGHGQPPADSSEGQRPDYSMMALVLLSIAITAIGLTGVRAVWQARRRRLRQAKENDSQKLSSLVATIGITQEAIAPWQATVGRSSLQNVGQKMQERDDGGPMNAKEEENERKLWRLKRTWLYLISLFVLHEMNWWMVGGEM